MPSALASSLALSLVSTWKTRRALLLRNVLQFTGGTNLNWPVPLDLVALVQVANYHVAYGYSYRHCSRSFKNKRDMQEGIQEMRWISSHNYPYKQSHVKVGDILHHWSKQFQLQNICDAESSAELIIAHVLGKKTMYHVGKQAVLTRSQIQEVDQLCAKRLTRMPVQYVLGEWDFCDVTLKLRPPVLIPRPETEELAHLCMKSVADQIDGDCLKFLEIGVGSGALSLSLLRHFPQLTGVAVDISPIACSLTSDNADLLGVKDRLQIIEGDFSDYSVHQHLQGCGPYCLLVSNPPYITGEEMKELQPEILYYEDHQALDGGPDGLKLIKEILYRTEGILHPAGHLWLEVGAQHATPISQFLQDQGLDVIFTHTSHKDTFGKIRFIHLQHHNLEEKLPS